MGKRGLTFIEILVVLAIIAMVLGMSVPFFSGFGTSSRLRAASRELASVLRMARGHAITYRNDHSVHFDLTETPHQYYVTDQEDALVEKKYSLPKSIEIKAPQGEDPITFPEDTLIFKPTGGLASPSGAIIITDKRDNTKTITVNGVTGRIRIE